LLQSQCRTSDYLCRYGGEELCVLLPNADESVAAAWAERARQAIEDSIVTVGEHAVRVTASIGVAQALGATDTMEQLIDRADQALIVAKKLGRNRVMCASAMSDTGAVLEQVRMHGAVFHGVDATDVMTTPVASLPLESTVGEAAEFLRKTRINSAPVVDRQGKLVGVLSEKDVICILPSHAAWNMPIERIMQRTFVSFEEDSPLEAICEFLSRVTVRRVFVVREGAPIGVVSQGNLLRWYGTQVAAGRVPGEPCNVDDAPPESRERLLEGAEAVAECAAKLAKHASDAKHDPLAPVVDRVRKLQDLVDALIAASAGKRIPIDLTDSDSFPAGALQYVPSAGHK